MIKVANLISGCFVNEKCRGAFVVAIFILCLWVCIKSVVWWFSACEFAHLI